MCEVFSLASVKGEFATTTKNWIFAFLGASVLKGKRI